MFGWFFTLFTGTEAPFGTGRRAVLFHLGGIRTVLAVIASASQGEENIYVGMKC